MISESVLALALGRLMALPFFPSDHLVKAAVLEELQQMVANDEQLEWLIRRVTGLYKEWPGLSEIRAVYCSRFRPRDGVEVYSGVYPDGIPSERLESPPASSNLRLNSAGQLALPPGDAPISADPKVEKAVEIAIAVVKLKNRAFNAPITEEEIAAAPEWLRKLEGYE